MTSASFYKGDNSKQGVFFDLPEEHLARELKRRKLEEHSRGLKADKIIAENH